MNCQLCLTVFDYEPLPDTYVWIELGSRERATFYDGRTIIVAHTPYMTTKGKPLKINVDLLIYLPLYQEVLPGRSFANLINHGEGLCKFN